MEPISFRYTPTVKDYVIASRRRVLGKWMIWSLFLGFLMVGVGLKVVSPALAGVSCVWIFVGAALLSLAYVYLVRPLLVARRVRRNERIRCEATWTLDEESILIATRYGEARINWDNYLRVEETKHHYYLALTGAKQTFQMIPKRAFESPEQEKAFRDLLVEHGLMK